ncbi:MAG: transposase [Gammaproteobacteria bacterium]
MSKTNRTYTKEFKEEALQLALSFPSLSATARELDLPKATLYSWLHKARELGQCPIKTDKGSMTMTAAQINRLIEENKQFRKQMARIEQEKALLKKAATYFAKEIV